MKRPRWLWVVALVAVSSWFVAPNLRAASERPGGGSSFSGGSRSSGSSSSRSSSSSSSSRSSSSSSSSRSSGSSGSGSDDLAFDLIFFLFSSGVGAPALVTIVIALFVLGVAKRRLGNRLNWDAGTGAPVPRPRVRPLLEKIRTTDPNFSIVLFEDFLYALYAQAHTLRGQQALDRLSSHLKPSARETLASLGPVHGVRSVIIGAMRFLKVEGVDGNASTVRVEVEFESNYSETPESRAEQSYYARETWTLSRGRSVLSRTPDRARVFACPSCGAPLDTMIGGRCQYCQATVDTGQFDWVVDGIAVDERETRGPILTGTTEETGTNLPSVIDPDVARGFAELQRKDPSFVWPALQSRVAMIFAAMQSSWSNREWAAVRPFVSDNLFQMLAYWIEAYKKERLRNVTEGAAIERIELARVSSDKFFDALTVRVFASSLDYTIADDDGRVVGGNRTKPRRYSEYWTLIRGAGRQGAARTDGACPSCGAPLRIEMAGTCTYCRAKVTSGEFDWVLSRIEQDEVYEG